MNLLYGNNDVFDIFLCTVKNSSNFKNILSHILLLNTKYIFVLNCYIL